MKEYEIVQEPICRTCQYYHEHYVHMGNHYHELFYGHCCYPRIKNRYDHQTCRYWTPNPEPVSTEEASVSPRLEEHRNSEK